MKNFNHKIVILLVLFVALFNFACPVKEFDKNRPEKEKAEFYARLHVEVPRYESVNLYKTASGVSVATQDPIPAEHLDVQLKLVDQAAKRVILESEGKGWTNDRSPENFAVLMIRPTYTKTQGRVGAGAIRLRSGDPIAGTVIALPTKQKNVYFDVAVIAQNWDYPTEARDALRNEFQHVATQHNDYQMHLRHAYNDVHPLEGFQLPDENEWQASPIE